MFWTGEQRPTDLKDRLGLSEFVRDVPAQTVIVTRYNSFQGEKWFSPGTDIYDLPLRRGFTIERYEFWHGRMDTHASRCAGDAGGQYFQGRYGAAVEGGNIIKVDWGVWRCHTSPGIFQPEWDRDFSGYGLNIYVKGPRGESPFINPLLK
jgi:hypothetical protein